MKARKHYGRFSTAPVLNDRGHPIVALMVDRQPHILRAIAEHNQLTAEDILVIVGGNKRSLYDTLRTLKAELNEYIRIVPEQVRARNLRGHSATSSPQRYSSTQASSDVGGDVAS